MAASRAVGYLLAGAGTSHRPARTTAAREVEAHVSAARGLAGEDGVDGGRRAGPAEGATSRVSVLLAPTSVSQNFRGSTSTLFPGLVQRLPSDF
jgi:hypothetical protein